MSIRRKRAREAQEMSLANTVEEKAYIWSEKSKRQEDRKKRKVSARGRRKHNASTKNPGCWYK